MNTWPPAVWRSSLIVAPLGPMRSPTRSRGTGTSQLRWPCPAALLLLLLLAEPPVGRPIVGIVVEAPPRAEPRSCRGVCSRTLGAPGGRGGGLAPAARSSCCRAGMACAAAAAIGWAIGCGGWGGRGAPSGQFLLSRVSLISCSVFSISPTMVTVPSGSGCLWSILISAQLLARSSWIVSPPRPMSARIWAPSSRSTLNLPGSTPGGGSASFFPAMSCNHAGIGGVIAADAGPSSSHLERFFWLWLLLLLASPNPPPSMDNEAAKTAWAHASGAILLGIDSGEMARLWAPAPRLRLRLRLRLRRRLRLRCCLFFWLRLRSRCFSLLRLRRRLRLLRRLSRLRLRLLLSLRFRRSGLALRCLRSSLAPRLALRFLLRLRLRLAVLLRLRSRSRLRLRFLSVSLSFKSGSRLSLSLPEDPSAAAPSSSLLKLSTAAEEELLVPSAAACGAVFTSGSAEVDARASAARSCSAEGGATTSAAGARSCSRIEEDAEAGVEAITAAAGGRADAATAGCCGAAGGGPAGGGPGGGGPGGGANGATNWGGGGGGLACGGLGLLLEEEVVERRLAAC